MYQKDLESLYLIDSRIVQSVLNIQLERCNFPSSLKRVRVMPMGSAGNRTSNFIERREKERERIFIGKHFATVSRCGKNLANKFIEVVGWQ